jgi:hypothetical protein
MIICVLGKNTAVDGVEDKLNIQASTKNTPTGAVAIILLISIDILMFSVPFFQHEGYY